VFDTWSPYDPHEADSPEIWSQVQRKLERQQQDIRAMLPRLRQEIENPRRDVEKVYQVLRPYYENLQSIPMSPADLTEIEPLCRLVLERGGRGQDEIQQGLLRLVGNTAALESIPFLLEMLRYRRPRDHFGPQRRQLALWGLARIAIWHEAPADVFMALREGLDDRQAEVRTTAADLILNAYLDAGRPVPAEVIAKLHQMSQSDPDEFVRRQASKFLREPWARS
jgi:hypothetical protein